MKQYLKFGLMILTSFLIMYGVMFLNVFQVSHVALNTMRTYMTILMIAPMTIVMMLYMWGMYKNKLMNFGIIGLSIFIFGLTFYMMRNQTGISDIQYMKGMIPHHSTAILTSEKANLKDPETRELAAEIIESQKREIAEMRELIEKLEQK